MPDSSNGELIARLETAVSVLEAEDWSHGLSLLIGLVQDAHVQGDHRMEALGRAMMAQTLLQAGQPVEAQKQAEAAFLSAKESNHRDTIHRCMALLDTNPPPTET